MIGFDPAAAEGRPTIAPGTYTTTIYSLIRDSKWSEVMPLLQTELDSFPRSRAALSLLGFSAYNQGNFEKACEMYDRLVAVCPDVEDYKLYHAQSLFKAGIYDDALRVLSSIQSEQLALRLSKMRAIIEYEQDNLPACKSLLDQCPADDADVVIMSGCVLFKEGKYDEARNLFSQAELSLGYRPDIGYNLALCSYKMGVSQYAKALEQTHKVIQKGYADHPELPVGGEATAQRSVGNSAALRESALVEVFNLKAAIDYTTGGLEEARDDLNDMPPRTLDELDHITLHNVALINFDDQPTEGFEKLQFLITAQKFPAETFANLMLLYVKYGYFNLAADVMAEHPILTREFLSDELRAYVTARIAYASSPADSYHQLDELASKHIENLRKLASRAEADKAAQREGTGDKARTSMQKYDEALEQYIPVLMAQAAVYWEIDHYAKVEELFKQSTDFASEHHMWKLNLAHVFYMQEGKWQNCIHHYEDIIAHRESLLGVSAIVLANLCVAYVMISENDKAEEVMRRVEREEEAAVAANPDKRPPLHLCIINLVIGTLYCAKGNFEFGITRVIKSLEPYSKKIETDTWYYAKRCFLALGETLAKQMITLKDSTAADVLAFLDAADTHGKDIKARIDDDPMSQVRSFVVLPARLQVASRSTSSHSSEVHCEEHDSGGGAPAEAHVLALV